MAPLSDQNGLQLSGKLDYEAEVLKADQELELQREEVDRLGQEYAALAAKVGPALTDEMPEEKRRQLSQKLHDASQRVRSAKRRQVHLKEKRAKLQRQAGAENDDGEKHNGKWLKREK
ncbi:hypothetical protein NW762_010393 [Fusarium torreyae]|uniref:Uncharacterized protein n=1 Tax=Fusarium torreyae TaxID=1237075 RepID=A0A9W8RV06_9HYPO|nr:hypothetical protein NW762_010393 [Fusarium torreyae]